MCDKCYVVICEDPDVLMLGQLMVDLDLGSPCEPHYFTNKRLDLIVNRTSDVPTSSKVYPLLLFCHKSHTSWQY